MRTFRIIRLTIFIAVGSVSIFAQQEIPSDLEITLMRTRCFGWCPHYSLTITADGVVKFTPLAGFAYIGKGEVPKFPIGGQISTDQIRHLLAEFEKIKFNSLRDRYGSDSYKRSAACPKISTDALSAELSIVEGGKRKTVWHYLGCSGTQTLNDLVALENKVDEITNSGQWVSQFGWGTANVVDLKIKKNPQ